MYAADYLVHFSNILLLVAYSVRDILWLRWFAVAAALTNIPYFLVQADILWPPVLWATVFTAINLFQIARIYMERRPVVLSGDEQKLYDLAFRVLRPREFLSLMLAGEWRDAIAGQKLLTEGQAAAEICIPIAGTLEVRRHGAPVGTLAPGQLVGTGLVLTGNPSPVDASFNTAARYFAWPVNTLRSFLDKRPDLRTTLLRLANRDLAEKLERVMSAR
jgi:signal transduction histidine kinase